MGELKSALIFLRFGIKNVEEDPERAIFWLERAEEWLEKAMARDLSVIIIEESN